MPRVIAIALPPGPAFVDALRQAWDRGDAVLPVDPRLPAPAREALLDALRPAEVVEAVGERHRRHDAVPSEEGDALVVATSGTTGDPKGVVLTHDAVRASASSSSRRLEVDPSVDRWLSLLPVSHIGGLSVITRAVVAGVALTFDADDADATLTSVVPTQANRLDLSRFRVVLVGGSADWRERPANLVRTYGMTETGSGVAYDGRLLDDVEMRIDDSGQISVRGPMLLRTYRSGTRDGDHDPKDADGWLATGDAGSIDEDGLLHVDGRVGDVIVTGGEKVWPTPVESVLRHHPDVVDVAVAGRPDPEWGQRVVAWIVVRDAASPPSLESLRATVKSQLPAYAAPRAVVVVPDLPRTPIGKVRRELLAEGR